MNGGFYCVAVTSSTLKGIPNGIMDTYCWIHSTFSIPERFNIKHSLSVQNILDTLLSLYTLNILITLNVVSPGLLVNRAMTLPTLELLLSR